MSPQLLETDSTSMSVIGLYVDLRELRGQPPTHLPGVCQRRHTAGCSSPHTQRRPVQPQLQHIWNSQESNLNQIYINEQKIHLREISLQGHRGSMAAERRRKLSALFQETKATCEPAGQEINLMYQSYSQYFTL